MAPFEFLFGNPTAAQPAVAALCAKMAHEYQQQAAMMDDGRLDIGELRTDDKA